MKKARILSFGHEGIPLTCARSLHYRSPRIPIVLLHLRRLIGGLTLCFDIWPLKTLSPPWIRSPLLPLRPPMAVPSSLTSFKLPKILSSGYISTLSLYRRSVRYVKIAFFVCFRWTLRLRNCLRLWFRFAACSFRLWIRGLVLCDFFLFFYFQWIQDSCLS